MPEMGHHTDLGHLLLEEGLINDDQLRRARSLVLSQGKSIGRALVDMKVLTEHAKMTFLHKKYGYEIVDLSDLDVDPGVLTRISAGFAEKHRCVPILIQNRHLVVAMDDPTDITVIDGIRAQSGLEPLPVLAPLADIDKVLLQYPRGGEPAARARGGAAPAAERSLLFRILHPLGFLLVMIAPLIVLWAIASGNPRFLTRMMVNNTSFDIALYVVLGWALWSIVIWEIDGLIFGRRR